MSKSYNNHLELFGDEKELRARIMRIVTDSKGLADPKEPETCTVFRLYRLFAEPDDARAMAEQYRAGGFGYGDAKKALFEAMQNALAPFRRRRAELAENLDGVEAVLRHGAERARAAARETLDKARMAMGLA